MSVLAEKKIIVAITGGIAAYKSIELIRLLKKAGSEVRVVLTPAAKAFVTPLTLQAVSGNAVSDSLLDESAELAMGHIELAKWADAVVIAPATADVIARLRAGMANDLLTTLCLATTVPILLAPAMNQQMFAQEVTQENLQTLLKRGMQAVGPDDGVQACGDIGKGRMSEPCDIFSALEQCFTPQDAKNLHVVITAGATREPLDPVRFLTNYSSGKMGFALAQSFAKRGAKVTLLAGNVTLPTPLGVERINIVSCLDLLREAENIASKADIFIGCAAVADFRPKTVAGQKIKKQSSEDETMTLTLVKNPDVIANIAKMTKNRPFVVGFAAETNNLDAYAKDKLIRKNLDMICANDVSEGKGFNQDLNAIKLFAKIQNQIYEKDLGFLPKTELATKIADEVLEHFKNQ